MSAPLKAHIDRNEAGVFVKSPGVGVFRPLVGVGDFVNGGDTIGSLSVLGKVQPIRCPEGVRGECLKIAKALRTVDYETILLELGETSQRDQAVQAKDSSRGEADKEGLCFLAPMSGRFYRHPAPDDAPFVEEGQTLNKGDTIGLLEVMKTFNRLVFEGDAFPQQVLVKRIAVSDGDDVLGGDLLLELAELEA